MLLMLHLTLVGSDRVCAKHGVDATAAAMNGYGYAPPAKAVRKAKI